MKIFSASDIQHKIFVIGLPRTGTTSFCEAMLRLGFRTAHTAYTQQAFDSAQVIADTPVFCDYQALACAYPTAKFIYLTRNEAQWLPSIKQLLNRMYVNVTREDGGFNPHIKRCYQQIFSPFTYDNINDDQFLMSCYAQHQTLIKAFFVENSQACESRLLNISISNKSSLEQFEKFLTLPVSGGRFSHLNKGGKVTAWKDIKHPLKIESTNNGRVSKLSYTNCNS